MCQDKGTHVERGVCTEYQATTYTWSSGWYSVRLHAHHIFSQSSTFLRSFFHIYRKMWYTKYYAEFLSLVGLSKVSRDHNHIRVLNYALRCWNFWITSLEMEFRYKCNWNGIFTSDGAINDNALNNYNYLNCHGAGRKIFHYIFQVRLSYMKK